MSLTKSQLEALVDDIYKSNGVGAITGPVPNYLMKQIIAAIFDNLPGGAAVTPDGRSIKLNANKQLEVYLPEWLSMDPSSQAAPVIKFNQTGGMHGLWVKVDGRTIFGNNGILTTSGGGGGTNPNITIEAYDFQDDTFTTEVETRNAYLSESGTNGYLKLATGESEDYGYINSKSVVTMDQNPILTVKMKLESVTDTVAKIYLSELTNGQSSGAGIMLVYDSSVDAYWHLVVTDGGENTVNLATLIAADTDEHLFDIRVKDGNIAWLIDDEVAGTEDSIDLGDSELKCGVSVESLSADGTAMVIDTISKLSVRAEETGVEFSVTPVHEKFTPVSYGLLYNGYVAADARKISSNDDWVVARRYYEADDLANFIGASIAGGALKIAGTEYWDSPNTDAVNTYGFNAKGAGWRLGSDGTFSGFKQSFYFGLTPDTGGALSLAYNSAAAVMGGGISSDWGVSIRLCNPSTLKSNGETGTYTGNDGKVYQTVVINGVEWITENLAETKYRNGDLIPEVTDNAAWSELTTGARCAPNGDSNNV